MKHLIDFAIRYFTHLKKTYGSDKERKSEIRVFDDVDAKKVVVRNQKLYVNRAEGLLAQPLERTKWFVNVPILMTLLFLQKKVKCW